MMEKESKKAANDNEATGKKNYKMVGIRGATSLESERTSGDKKKGRRAVE